MPELRRSGINCVAPPELHPLTDANSTNISHLRRFGLSHAEIKLACNFLTRLNRNNNRFRRRRVTAIRLAL